MMTVRMMTAVITKPLAKVISSEGARLWLARLLWTSTTFFTELQLEEHMLGWQLVLVYSF